jgi:hypothetical protein
MHAEAERTERQLLPEVVTDLIQRHEQRRRARRAASATGFGTSPGMLWPGMRPFGGLDGGVEVRGPHHVQPLGLCTQNGINGTTMVRRTITATNTAVKARSIETDPSRTGLSTRRTGPITGSVMPWVIRRAW